MLVPIACRFVPYDQWLVTHLDDEWKVKHVKHWILSKCNLQSSGPQTRRSVSPITFAPTVRPRSSLDSIDDGYNEDDEFSEQDLPSRSFPFKLHPRRDVKPRLSSQTVQPGSSPLVDRYTLLSFSTGSVLEDEFALSWYNLGPYELLEMHPVGTIAPLRRELLAEYIRPYFQAKVRVLRILWNHKLGRFEAPRMDDQYEHNGHMTRDRMAVHPFDSLSKSSSSQSGKKHKAKINWKARWVVIHQGMLSLCKEHVATTPVHQFALSNITALHGPDAFERAFSIVTQSRVVCIQCRPPSAPLTGVVSPSVSPSSPISEGRRSSEPLVHTDSVSDSKQLAEQELRGKSYEHSFDSSDPLKGGEWVILDMLDDHAFSSVLRILHREVSQPIPSSFAPSSSIIAVSPRSAGLITLSSYETIPYPEWRIHTVENARKAGLGDVGKAMAWVMWSEKGLGESLTGNIREHRQAFSQEMRYKSPVVPTDIYGPIDDSDDESEMEWEGWMRDLERQSGIKQQADKGSTTEAHVVCRASTQLPSPPASEASSCGSPRDRSPSLSIPSTQGPYRNISHVIGSNVYGGEPGYSREMMKSTTKSIVSVGTSPPPRRRSSTLANMVTTGKPNQARVPSMSVTSAHSNTIRHAHSSSNLGISSPCESEVGELVVQPATYSPPKGQNAFMRRMSLRAGKIVRGLESAIDFVDEKGSSSLHN